MLSFSQFLELIGWLAAWLSACLRLRGRKQILGVTFLLRYTRPFPAEFRRNAMRRFLVRFLAAIGALAIVYVIVIAVLLAGRKPHVPSKAILEVNLEQPMVEYVPNQPF